MLKIFLTLNSDDINLKLETVCSHDTTDAKFFNWKEMLYDDFLPFERKL